MVLVVAALLGAGCSGDDGGTAAATSSAAPITFEFSGDAATVAGEPIAASVLADALDVFRSAPAALEAAFPQTDLDQAGSDQPSPVIVANLLTTEISLRVIAAELMRRGLTVTDGARQVGATQVKAAFGDSLADQPAYQQQLIDRFAQFVTLDQALAGLDDETLRAEYDKDPSKYDQACAAHILVGTEELANRLLTQLQAGADFATLAAANSTDPNSKVNGGELGCQSRGMYVEPFEKAVWDGPLNVVQGPIKTDFGYHLIRVTQRGSRTFEQAKEDVRSALSPEPFTALGTWLQQTLSAAPVTVDPRFGTWDGATGQVVPLGVSASPLSIQPAEGSATTGPAPRTPITAPGGGSATTLAGSTPSSR